MGEESTGDSGTAYAEEIDYLSKQRKRQQEERAIRSQEEETGKSLYARSESGNIIRSASSGRGVTSRAGRQAQEDYRAAYDGRESRDMDAEFPMDTESGESATSGSSTIEVARKASAPASRAARRLLAQNQKSTSMRQFYN